MKNYQAAQLKANWCKFDAGDLSTTYKNLCDGT